MEKELERLINIYGVDAITVFLNGKKWDAKHDEYRKNWNIDCRRFGLKPEHLGMRFVSGKDTFITTGIKTANRKYPILADRVKDGKPFKFAPDFFLATQKVESLKKTLLEEMEQEAS